MSAARNAVVIVAALLALPGSTNARRLTADPRAASGAPGYYRTLARSLQPGDTLFLPAGVYMDMLNLDGLQGTPSAWITIMGPATGPAATITTTSNCCNTVQLGGNAYLAIRNLIVDSAGLDGADGINAKESPTHDILIENCTLIGQDAGQGTIGISTKSPAWRWTIRGNRIIQAGTGLYLGNSDGNQPFVAGIIENNLVLNTIGYNMEIKHQLPYEGQLWTAGLPTGPNRTIIRGNVFIKQKDDWDPAKTAGVRPNLLVDPFPDTGLGSSDMYEIYGNFFYKNPNEVLLQATGRIAAHDNVFVASSRGNSSITFTDHNGPLKLVHVYNNTVYSAVGNGIRFSAAPRQGGYVRGNLIVAGGTALDGPAPATAANLLGSPTDGKSYFTTPSETLGEIDLYPNVSCAGCVGGAIDLTPFAGQVAYDVDFNGASKGTRTYRGAYAAQGVNPGWRLAADIKPMGTRAGGEDATPTDSPADVRAP